MKKYKLSIIIVSYNTRSLTKKCLDSIYNNAPKIAFEIIVIDNASRDESLEMLKKNFEKIRNFKLVKSHENLGFSKGNNLGLKNAKGEYILFLNSDTFFEKNILDEMISWMDENKKTGVASCALKNEDGSVQGTGGHFPTLIRVASWMLFQDLPLVDRFILPFHPMKKKIKRGAGFYQGKKELDWVTGAFFLSRREILKKTGGFDKEYFMYTEDVDLCYRIKELGWRVSYLPRWSVTHFGGASSTREFVVLSEFAGIKRFYKKHYPKWQYPILRVLLKLGALWRIFLNPKTYAKAFIKA